MRRGAWGIFAAGASEQELPKRGLPDEATPYSLVESFLSL